MAAAEGRSPSQGPCSEPRELDAGDKARYDNGMTAGALGRRRCRADPELGRRASAAQLDVGFLDAKRGEPGME